MCFYEKNMITFTPLPVCDSGNPTELKEGKDAKMVSLFLLLLCFQTHSAVRTTSNHTMFQNILDLEMLKQDRFCDFNKDSKDPLQISDHNL